ncbi:Mur ligase family protein [Pedobacter steynii]
MAFSYFSEQNVDIAIIEVGLGGRLDSTNIITPELSVITNISLDHTNILGNTLREIAGEKAGIIKPGIPVVIGESHPETDPVFIQKQRKLKVQFSLPINNCRLANPLRKANF